MPKKKKECLLPVVKDYKEVDEISKIVYFCFNGTYLFIREEYYFKQH